VHTFRPSTLKAAASARFVRVGSTLISSAKSLLLFIVLYKRVPNKLQNNCINKIKQMLTRDVRKIVKSFYDVSKINYNRKNEISLAKKH